MNRPTHSQNNPNAASVIRIFLTMVFTLFGMFKISGAILYVDLNSQSPASPYANWTTAANSIQDAIDIANPGDTVVVTNGVYKTGGRVVYGLLTNRVVINKAVMVQSVNGPTVTFIQGYQTPGTTNGDSATRCVYLTNNATLAGFTLTNGATRSSGDPILEESGGGVWCESLGAIVFNCVLTGNKASSSGGGIYNGSVIDCAVNSNSAGTNGGGTCTGFLIGCTLTGNSAFYGGGACTATLNYCTVNSNAVARGQEDGAGQGGGAFQCTLNNCTLAWNTAWDEGGAACQGTLNYCTLNANFAFYTGGGGAANAILSNCTLTGNYTYAFGGGAFQGTLNNCTLMGNSAAYGGGAHNSTLNYCMVSSNSALDSFGGGTYRGTLNNCILNGNTAGTGSAAAFGTLNSCTLVGNSIIGPGGSVTAQNDILNNCIIYFNSEPTNANFDGGSILSNCCTIPLPENGIGNITNAPLFVNQAGGDYHLRSNSPCINSGNNAYVTTTNDFDGNPRIVGSAADIGVYEYQTPGSIISYAWLQDYGLPTDGSADFSDSDGDGMNNWQEWTAGTDPTDPLSVLKMLSPTNSRSGIEINWQSVSNRTYFLQRSQSLFPQQTFLLIQTNITGQVDKTSFIDTNANGPGPYFYRVGIQQ